MTKKPLPKDKAVEAMRMGADRWAEMLVRLKEGDDAIDALVESKTMYEMLHEQAKYYADIAERIEARE